MYQRIFPLSEPREGPSERMPPCLRLAVFEGRAITFYDEMGCKHEDPASMPVRYEVRMGRPDRWRLWAHEDHREVTVPEWWASSLIMNLRTDDPDEAQAAFDKGAEYVRTGVVT